MPALQALDAVAEEKLAGAFFFHGDLGIEKLEPLLGALQVWCDVFLEKTDGDFSQFHLGREMLAAVACAIFRIRRSEGFQLTEALAGGAFADAKAQDDIIKGEGFRADKQQAVDFPQGTGQREHLRKLHKYPYNVLLQRIRLLPAKSPFIARCHEWDVIKFAGKFNII